MLEICRSEHLSYRLIALAPTLQFDGSRPDLQGGDQING